MTLKFRTRNGASRKLDFFILYLSIKGGLTLQVVLEQAERNSNRTIVIK